MAKYEKTERLEKVPMEYLMGGTCFTDNLYNYNGRRTFSAKQEKLSRKANLIN